MSSTFETLLGTELTSAAADTSATVDKMADVDAVLLYFSAHWCPPCRGFTPKLSQFYSDMKAAGKKLEIVFVSSDKDLAAFEGYVGEMPFLALPYADRARKDALSKKYKVQGIPSLVVLDGATGETISTNGRQLVSEDPVGANFPWKPKPFNEIFGAKLSTPTGELVDRVEALAGKTYALYFSAHWCGPCRGFTPELIKTYKAMKAAGNTEFEIVFVSSDRDQTAFDNYFEEMPWLALPYSERAAKDALNSKCEVGGIPTLVIIGPDGEIINKDGRAALSKDPTGANFPWLPPAYKQLEESSTINEAPHVIVMVEGCTPEVVAAVEAAVKTVAEEAGKASEIQYTFAPEGDRMASQVRALMGAANTEPASTPLLCLIDIQDNGAFYTATGVETVDAQALKAFVDAFGAKALERQQFGQ